MTIDTSNIRKYSKLLRSVDSGILHLDFNTQSIYLAFDTFQRLQAKIRFNAVIDPSDSILLNESGIYNDLHIDASSFLGICEQYEEITYTKSKQTIIKDNNSWEVEVHSFSHGDDVFHIPHSQKKTRDKMKDIDVTQFQTFALDSKGLSYFRDASKFTKEYSATGRNFGGISIMDNRIVSSDIERMYYATMPVFYPRININDFALHVLLTIPCEGDISVFVKSENEVYFLLNSEEILLFSNTESSLYTAIIIEKDAFLNSLDIATSLVVNKQDFSDILKLYANFTKLDSNNRVQFRVVNEKQLAIEVLDNMLCRRFLDIKECSADLVGKSFFFNRATTLASISIIQDEFVRFKVQPDFYPIFTLTGEEDSDVKISNAIYQGNTTNGIEE